MGRKKLYPANDFIKAIPGTGGIIATIARRVGCDWWTVKRAIDRYSTVKEAYDAECETVTDMAESTLIKSIKDGDVASAKWWLTRKRKSSFGEAIDLTTGGQQMQALTKPASVDPKDVLQMAAETGSLEALLSEIGIEIVDDENQD